MRICDALANFSCCATSAYRLSSHKRASHRRTAQPGPFHEASLRPTNDSPCFDVHATLFLDVFGQHLWKMLLGNHRFRRVLRVRWINLALSGLGASISVHGDEYVAPWSLKKSEEVEVQVQETHCSHHTHYGNTNA